MTFLPGRGSRRWYIVGAVSVAVTTLLLWLVRFAVLGQPWTGVHAVRYFLAALAVSAAAAIAGALGARLLALSLLAGNLLGLLLMALAARGNTGWEDLASLLLYLELLALGLALGIAAELVRLLLSRLGRRKP